MNRNNQQQHEPIRNENNNMNRPNNMENHNEVLNRIDHRDAAMYEMNQQQMHKMDSLDNKLD